jgi:hypothetical protein
MERNADFTRQFISNSFSGLIWNNFLRQLRNSIRCLDANSTSLLRISVYLRAFRAEDTSFLTRNSLFPHV